MFRPPYKAFSGTPPLARRIPLLYQSPSPRGVHYSALTFDDGAVMLFDDGVTMTTDYEISAPPGPVFLPPDPVV